jgi:serine protease Do
VHSPVSTAVSFTLLALVVGGSFAYVSLNPIKEAWLGFSGSDVTPAIAQQIGLESQHGFLVFTVEPGSPAAAAGMQGGGRNAVIGGKPVILGGDVIIGVDGVPVTGGDDIIRLLGPKDIGDTVTFTIIRENTTHDLSLVIGEKQR